VAWGGYFVSLLSGFGVVLPPWLTHGYRAVQLSADPAVSGLMQTAPHVAGIPILVNLPAFLIVALITWLLLLGVKESARANNIMVVVKLLVLTLFVVVGALHVDTANYVPFAPNGWKGIHQGAAIVFFAYIGFDAISTAAEETKNPQRQPADRHPRRTGDLHVHLRGRGARRHGARSLRATARVRPPRQGARRRGPTDGELDRELRSRRLAHRGAAGLSVRPAAHLLRDGA
jgi:hypothetical protein